ncbi:MAG: alpha/beta hydrolase [Bacteroidetes bacterium]|nr:alpha/beta hydrolase [Bacteroidota bacterium]MBP7398373.1 alpha/beta hydrolase [Chitinophagales bacterium]MBK8681206.1 alpha/beta hydrolase [Bacteroidota bacterium]MBP8753822.1 alpha/beta hydrolase [Chitinophagales bacterium]MBP9188084.1 alpha/beta hydrolase [Chitinophagales bacterium]
METSILKYKDSYIHYSTFGNGSETLLAFHGFGESSNSFHCLNASLGFKFTVYSFDLPYHGDTIWNESNHFTHTDLECIITMFTSEKSIQHFSVLGFSMGGKFAMAVAFYMTERIVNLFLLASDGIRTKKLYNIAVYPKWGRYLFKTTISRPTWFFNFIHFLNRRKLISPWLHKFTMNHMDTEQKRKRLFDSWISMVDFKVNVIELKQKLNDNAVHIYLFFGERDEVIPVSVGEYFAKGLLNCRLVILPRGHYFIDELLNAEITKVLA